MLENEIIERYHGQPLPISVIFPSNPLTIYNLDYSDITEVTMNLKLELATDADDAYLERSSLVVGDVVIDEPNHRFIMKMADGYAQLVKGETYYITVNIRVAAFTDLIELKIDEDNRKVLITDDTNRA